MSKEAKVLEGKTMTLAPAVIPENAIVFSCNNGAKEILKFTEEAMFLYGEQVDCPEDIVKGLRDFLTTHNFFDLREKAIKYDALYEAGKKYKHNRLDNVATVVSHDVSGMCPRFFGTTFVLYTRSGSGENLMTMDSKEFYENYTLIE